MCSLFSSPSPAIHSVGRHLAKAALLLAVALSLLVPVVSGLLTALSLWLGLLAAIAGHLLRLSLALLAGALSLVLTHWLWQRRQQQRPQPPQQPMPP